MNRTDRGRLGESIAATYLHEKGYEILRRNFRTRHGEVDIVCGTADRTVFVEVKTWSVFDADGLGRAINRRKQRRIIRAARSFLHEQPNGSRSNVRFDVIFVCATNRHVQHFEGAFDSEWPE